MVVMRKRKGRFLPFAFGGEDEDACTNQAESYFSRLRRADIGTHHHVSGPLSALLRA